MAIVCSSKIDVEINIDKDIDKDIDIDKDRDKEIDGGEAATECTLRLLLTAK